MKNHFSQSKKILSSCFSLFLACSEIITDSVTETEGLGFSITSIIFSYASILLCGFCWAVARWATQGIWQCRSRSYGMAVLQSSYSPRLPLFFVGDGLYKSKVWFFKQVIIISPCLVVTQSCVFVPKGIVLQLKYFTSSWGHFCVAASGLAGRFARREGGCDWD